MQIIKIDEIRKLDNMKGLNDDRLIKTDKIHKLDKMKGLTDDHINRIKKYKKDIEKYNLEDYKFGSGWIDLWFIKMKIKNLNKILNNYDIVLRY